MSRCDPQQRIPEERHHRGSPPTGEKDVECPEKQTHSGMREYGPSLVEEVVDAESRKDPPQRVAVPLDVSNEHTDLLGTDRILGEPLPPIDRAGPSVDFVVRIARGS